MNKKLFNKLLNNSHFLSVFYQARDNSQKQNIPLEASFIECGLNKYKNWFPKICLVWGINNLVQIAQFNKMVQVI